VRIEWINHASFLVEHGQVRLVCDPWLEGKAFADSWALLSESVFSTKDFADVTHIWLSHEHPDHFSPDTLRRIPPHARSRITVLFQRTRDRKVVQYCEGLAFKDVVELPAGSWTSLSDDFHVMCQPEAFDDSWLAIKAGDTVLLNLNDCFLNSDSELVRVRTQVRAPIDVLLTQFSFASWAGNQGEDITAARAASDARKRVLRHTRNLEPKVVIPCASYVWFCHEENKHLNIGMNRVADIVDLIDKETNSKPVVLYPGDAWSTASEEDPTSMALERYANDYESLLARDCVVADSVSLEVLASQADNFRRSLLQFHGLALRIWALAGKLPATAIWLKDHGHAVIFSLSGLEPLSASYSDCDVALTSSALALLFANFWGGMTLIVSGRFDVPSGGDLQVGGPPIAFRRYVMLADDANHGWRLRDELVLRMRQRLLPRRHSDWTVRHTPLNERPARA
jgi:UDP-MurNAc hydroxylase